MLYTIMGLFRGSTEVIDAFDSLEEAEEILLNYEQAFGEGWRLWILREKESLSL